MSEIIPELGYAVDDAETIGRLKFHREAAISALAELALYRGVHANGADHSRHAGQGAPDKPITTTQLAERILSSHAKKTHPAEYNRIFRILKDVAKNQLADCTSPGTPTKYMGRMTYPKLWHNGPLHEYHPKPLKPAKIPAATGTDHTICQHCGGKLPKV